MNVCSLPGAARITRFFSDAQNDSEPAAHVVDLGSIAADAADAVRRDTPHTQCGSTVGA